jgi:hypothetical protein
MDDIRRAKVRTLMLVLRTIEEEVLRLADERRRDRRRATRPVTWNKPFVPSQQPLITCAVLLAMARAPNNPSKHPGPNATWSIDRGDLRRIIRESKAITPSPLAAGPALPSKAPREDSSSLLGSAPPCSSSKSSSRPSAHRV